MRAKESQFITRYHPREHVMRLSGAKSVSPPEENQEEHSEATHKTGHNIYL